MRILTVKGIQRDQEHALSFKEHGRSLLGRGQRSKLSDVACRHRLPAKVIKLPHGGLLDELVFGVGVGHG